MLTVDETSRASFNTKKDTTELENRSVNFKSSKSIFTII